MQLTLESLKNNRFIMKSSKFATYMFGIVTLLLVITAWCVFSAFSSGHPVRLSGFLFDRGKQTSTTVSAAPTQNTIGTISSPPGWQIVNSPFQAIPVKMAIPNGWAMTATSTGSENIPQIEVDYPPANPTDYVFIEIDPDYEYGYSVHTIDELVNQSQLQRVSTTTIGGLPAVQGYPIYPAGDQNSVKDFDLLGPYGVVYSIEYDCETNPSVCDQIVSQMQFK